MYLQLDTLFGRPKKYGSAASSPIGGVGGNGIYSSGSTYGVGSRSLPRINSDNDISSGGQYDADECEMFIEHLDVEALNDKFEEMLVIKKIYIIVIYLYIPISYHILIVGKKLCYT